MEKLTKKEQFIIVGGCQAEIALLVANANANGADWTDEQWDEWARKYKAPLPSQVAGRKLNTSIKNFNMKI